MSRLAFGPKPKAMEVTDIASGHFVFSPVEGEVVSYEALDRAITDAGYEIENAALVLAGTLLRNRHLETPSGQVFHLKADDRAVKARLAELAPGDRLEVRGAWRFAQGAELVEVSEVSDGDGGPEGAGKTE